MGGFHDNNLDHHFQEQDHDGDDDWDAHNQIAVRTREHPENYVASLHRVSDDSLKLDLGELLLLLLLLV